MQYQYFIVLYLWYCFEECYSKRITYMITERPVVTYVNNLYLKHLIFTSRRNPANRRDPRYYTNIYAHTIVSLGNNIKIDFYFYEFLTNRYRPSFVELHFGFCDMIEKDPIFGSQFKSQSDLMNVSCPYPPGHYNFTDMAVSYVPKFFPFQKGRIYLNATLTIDRLVTQLLRASIDMELKETSYS